MSTRRLSSVFYKIRKLKWGGRHLLSSPTSYSTTCSKSEERSSTSACSWKTQTTRSRTKWSCSSMNSTLRDKTSSTTCFHKRFKGSQTSSQTWKKLPSKTLRRTWWNIYRRSGISTISSWCFATSYTSLTASFTWATKTRNGWTLRSVSRKSAIMNGISRSWWACMNNGKKGWLIIGPPRPISRPSS